MEEPTNPSTINELRNLLQHCQQRLEEKCAECQALEKKNRAQDDAINNLSKIIKTQNQELSELKKEKKEREVKKRLHTGPKKAAKYTCTRNGCVYNTSNKEDYDFHMNIHDTATVSHLIAHLLAHLLTHSLTFPGTAQVSLLPLSVVQFS